jgi:Acetyl-CoA hydrolase/transferase C-terminal domain
VPASERTHYDVALRKPAVLMIKTRGGRCLGHRCGGSRVSPARGELPHVDERAITIAAPRAEVGSASWPGCWPPHGKQSTLVERLSRPVTTGSHDVDIVATDRGIADLRGLDRDERSAALLKLWDGHVHRHRGGASPGVLADPDD